MFFVGFFLIISSQKNKPEVGYRDIYVLFDYNQLLLIFFFPLCNVSVVSKFNASYFEDVAPNKKDIEIILLSAMNISWQNYKQN